MHWLDRSLSRKFAVGTAAGLLASSLFFLILFVSLYRGQLERELAVAADQVSRLVQASLKTMLRDGDLAGLGAMAKRLTEEQGILDVKLVDRAGRVLVASDTRALGTVVRSDVGSEIGLEIGLDRPRPHAGSPGTGLDLIDDGTGRAILRSANPIAGPFPSLRSQPRLGSGEDAGAPSERGQPVRNSFEPSENGTLYVDFDATPIRVKARNTTLLLLGSGALIVLINLAGGWWFMHRYVIRPVARLSDVSQRLAAGDLDARIRLPGRDEFSRLAAHFNSMADSLRHKIRELEHKEDYLQALVDAIPDGVRVIDEDFRVVLANASYRQQLGYSAAHPAPDSCYAASHGRDTPCPSTLTLCTLKEVTASGKPLRLVHRHLRRDGEKRDVEVYAAPVTVVLGGRDRRMVVESIRDLTQQVRFSHEQRLSELGRLAAGVAHEIHNPLAALRMALHAAEEINQAPAADRARLAEYLALVLQQVDQCEHITRRLLKLSMPPPSQPELVALEQVLEDTLKLLEWEARSAGIETSLQVEGAPLRVLATDSDLRMMALNLVQNACHAMPEGGRLTVRCQRTPARPGPDSGAVAAAAGTGAGAQVTATFEDSGVGIDAANLVSIFEPFFSRRADGVRGTGLGLAITKAIVDSHGGSIEVDSTLGQGSRFTVRFADADGVADGGEVLRVGQRAVEG